jgi:diaminohydroxyphosphoribosylaminopyrimidine deaminase/5-amino-6-(5-phosphoribosylamino)uracil reductase
MDGKDIHIVIATQELARCFAARLILAEIRGTTHQILNYDRYIPWDACKVVQMPFLSDNKLNAAMQAACAEARKWMGATSPNPPVGAVALDAEGEIIATAAHHRAGEAHAEAALLEICRKENCLSDIHILCVTLEPCNHTGRTPPCSEAIINAGIKRVVIGTRDPNPNVTGGGIERLKQAGIEIQLGVAEQECRQLIHAFAYFAQSGKPWITVKRAFNPQGTMIPPTGKKTFTSQASLALAHRLRKKADAIITGSGTVQADNPMFTVRHVEDFPDKKRWLAIMDTEGAVPKNYLEAAQKRGFETVVYHNLDTAIQDLTRKGARDILVEAGPALSKAVLDSYIWTMSVTIRQTDPDKPEDIEVEFNPREKIPFAIDEFQWDLFLPA